MQLSFFLKFLISINIPSLIKCSLCGLKTAPIFEANLGLLMRPKLLFLQCICFVKAMNWSGLKTIQIELRQANKVKCGVKILKIYHLYFACGKKSLKNFN